jgi:hypothetical protein
MHFFVVFAEEWCLGVVDDARQRRERRGARGGVADAC